MLEPERVGAERFGEAKIATADCGGLHTAAVMEEGALYTWVAGGGGGETSKGYMNRRPASGTRTGTTSEALLQPPVYISPFW